MGECSSERKRRSAVPAALTRAGDDEGGRPAAAAVPRDTRGAGEPEDDGGDGTRRHEARGRMDHARRADRTPPAPQRRRPAHPSRSRVPRGFPGDVVNVDCS